jgi:endonuclease/exonuclease/phosphatase family metal-dependent hydrolase
MDDPAPATPAQASSPLFSCARLTWRAVLFLLLAGIALLAIACQWIGTRHYLVAPWCYLPLWLPAGIILLATLPGLWLDRRLALALAAASCFVVGRELLPWGGWQTSPPARQRDDSGILRVAFANRGEQTVSAWTRWIQQRDPDLIGMTEIMRAPLLRAGSPDVAGLPYLQRVGEHALASRFPFLSAGPIRVEFQRGMMPALIPAARFVVQAPGGPLAVYVLHIRSPRAALQRYLSRAAWSQTIAGVPRDGPGALSLRHYWEQQITAIDSFLTQLGNEPLPFVIAGDWNIPDFGPDHRRVSAALQDAHTVAGRGRGHTFPADDTLPLLTGRPWARLDRIHASRQFEILFCETQATAAAGGSQHLGLLADMRLP